MLDDFDFGSAEDISGMQRRAYEEPPALRVQMQDPSLSLVSSAQVSDGPGAAKVSLQLQNSHCLLIHIPCERVAKAMHYYLSITTASPHHSAVQLINPPDSHLCVAFHLPC